MISRHAFPRLLGVAVLCCSLGCGGSGTADVTITAQNAELLSAQAVAAADLMTEMANLAEGVGEAVANGSGTIPCDAGNINVFVTDAPPLTQLSAGDSVRVTFNGCVLSGLTLDGTMSVSVAALTGAQPGPYSFTLNCSFQGLTATILGGTVVVDGGFTLDVNSDDGDTVRAVMTGSYLSAFAQSGAATFSGKLHDFRFEREYTTSTGAYMGDIQGTVSGNRIGGRATFATTLPFTGTDPDDPDSGSLLVTGAEGGTLTFTALDNVNVEIVVDTDGDGTPEATINTTWAVINGN